jgi:hypothetical protein
LPKSLFYQLKRYNHQFICIDGKTEIILNKSSITAKSADVVKKTGLRVYLP